MNAIILSVDQWFNARTMVKNGNFSVSGRTGLLFGPNKSFLFLSNLLPNINTGSFTHHTGGPITGTPGLQQGKRFIIERQPDEEMGVKTQIHLLKGKKLRFFFLGF